MKPPAGTAAGVATTAASTVSTDLTGAGLAGTTRLTAGCSASSSTFASCGKGVLATGVKRW